MLQISQQEREHRFTFRHEHGRQLTTQIAIAQHRETLRDRRSIKLNPLARVVNAAREVYRQLLQLREMRQFVRMRRIQHSADSRHAV